MPHFQIEYSGNLEPDVDMAGFCEEIRKTAATHDAFPMPGVRVRAIKVDHFSIADGDAKHGFIDISIRLRAGRAPEVKKDATTRIFQAAETFLAEAMSRRSIVLSLEMRDIDPDLSPKTGTIRDYLDRDQSEAFS